MDPARLRQKIAMAKPGRVVYLTREEYKAMTGAPRDPLLVEREKTHGSFERNASLSQQLKKIFHDNLEFRGTDPIKYDAKREALDMIALKLSRILSGQANYKDHWRDLSGYSLLAMEACDEEKA